MDELEQKVQLRFHVSEPRLAPLQLHLFGEAPGAVVLRDALETEHAVAEALEMGWSVRLRRLREGFELRLTPPRVETEPVEPLAAVCGFSRRFALRLLATAEANGTPLWARPAGAAWPGWTEWGTLPLTE